MNRGKLGLIGLLAAGIWLLFPVLFVIIGYSTFVVPRTIGGLQAQGIKELPAGEQFLVDLTDFCKLRWFVVFPLLLILAMGTSAWFLSARRANTQSVVSN